MAGILIKTQPSYEQTGLAIRDYLKPKNIDVFVTLDQSPQSVYKEFTVLKHCVNTTIFSDTKKNRQFKCFAWSEFSIDKLLSIKGMPDLHIFGHKNWPTHQFIAKATYTDISFLSQLYSCFHMFKDDPDWLYMSLVYSGCIPLEKKNIEIVTVNDLVKELGIE